MDGSSLDFNLLAAFEVLLAERNVTRAAARLHLSQPALSARLNRLRELLGDPLLLPARRGMIPTDRALALEQPLREALERLRAVVAERAPFDPARATLTVAIAATDYIQQVLLLPLILALRREAPGLRIAWRALDVPRLAEQMERGEVDLAILIPETAPARLQARKLFDETYVCIARRGHPEFRRKLDLDRFVALDHVMVSPRGGGFAGPTDEALALHGRARRVVLSIPSFLMVPEIVARSDLVALVPERLVRNRTESLILCEPPLFVPGFAIGMLWHDRNGLPPAQRWLRERLASLCR